LTKKELRKLKQMVISIYLPMLAIDTAIDKLYPFKNRDNVLSILGAIEKPITILCGHYHTNDKQE
jgi:3',5'-cyclic-AMP phosphodiesterase